MRRSKEAETQAREAKMLDDLLKDLLILPELPELPEQRAVSVKAPWPAYLDDLEPGFVVTVQKLIGDLSGRRLVRQLKRFRAKPLHADHRDEAVGQDAAHRGIGL